MRNSLIATTETPSGRSSKNSCPSHENVGELFEHHIHLRPDTDLHPRSQGSILRGSAGNTIRNPKFRGHIFAKGFQRSRWDRLASMACLFGVCRMKENGQKLLELWCHHGLCISNGYFECKELHKVSWRHPRSRHWHQLDQTRPQ